MSFNDKRYKNRELQRCSSLYINMFFTFDIVISPQSHVRRVFPVSLQDVLHVISFTPQGYIRPLLPIDLYQR